MCFYRCVYKHNKHIDAINFSREEKSKLCRGGISKGLNNSGNVGNRQGREGSL